MEQFIGHPYDFIDRYNPPLFIKIPGYNSIIENVGGQVDIMTIIANLLGVDLERQIHFGQDIINYDKNLIGMRYYLVYW